MARRTTIGLVATLASAGALAATAAPGHAAPVRVGGGSTTVVLSSGALGGSTVSALRGSRAGAAGIVLTIDSGNVDREARTAFLRHRGGLRISRAGRSVRLSGLRLKLGSGSSVSALVDGRRRIPVFTVTGPRTRLSGLDDVATGLRLRLTASGARALRRVAGRTARAGRRAGTMAVRARQAELRFSGGTTTLALEPATVQALAADGVTLGAAAPAFAPGDGAIAFPIVPGSTLGGVDLSGSVDHNGGIVASRGGASVTLADPELFVRPAATLSALFPGAPEQDAVATLDLSDLTAPVREGGAVLFGGIVARLTGTAADALDRALGTTVFAAGMTLGVIDFRGELAVSEEI